MARDRIEFTSGMDTVEEEVWLRRAMDTSARFAARALSRVDNAGESGSDMVVVERGVVSSFSN